MSVWSWKFEGMDGASIQPDAIDPQTFSCQAHAESWVGESCGVLLSAGIEDVRLFEHDTEVYGPMSLRPAQ